MSDQNPYETPRAETPRTETPWAQAAPGPAGPVLSGPPLPPTAIGKFAYHALVPSLLLPVIVVLLGFLGAAERAAMYDFTGIVIAIFGFVLAGSMTLNTWLLMRHPESWRLRALPKGLSVQLVILWVLLILLGVVVYFTTLNLGSFVLAFALMILSVIVFVFTMMRRGVRTAVAPVVAVGPELYWRVIGIAYLVLVVLDVALGVLALYSGGPILSGILLVPLGLPWTWLLGIIAGFMLASQVAGSVLGILTLAGVALNVVVVVMLLIRPVFRVRFVNWFFKLRGSEIRTFASPAAPPPSP